MIRKLPFSLLIIFLPNFANAQQQKNNANVSNVDSSDYKISALREAGLDFNATIRTSAEFSIIFGEGKSSQKKQYKFRPTALLLRSTKNIDPLTNPTDSISFVYQEMFRANGGILNLGLQKEILHLKEDTANWGLGVMGCIKWAEMPYGSVYYKPKSIPMFMGRLDGSFLISKPFIINTPMGKWKRQIGFNFSLTYVAVMNLLNENIETHPYIVYFSDSRGRYPRRNLMGAGFKVGLFSDDNLGGTIFLGFSGFITRINKNFKEEERINLLDNALTFLSIGFNYKGK